MNLATLPVFWITIESAKDRHKKLSDIFAHFGFTNTHQINGEILDKTGMSFMEIQKKKSALVAKAHIEALRRTEPPFIILEDDVGVTEKLKMEIDIPPDADCVYLGSSIWGMDGVNSVAGGTKGTIIDSNYCRVQDMLGIHAILYLTKSYVEKTIQNLEDCISKDQFCDECVASDMINNRVYATSYPFFFQDDGRNNQVTLVPLAEYLR